jgi:hypothetical protein
LSDLKQLLNGVEGVEFKKEFNTIKYGTSRLRVATVDCMHEAYRFAGSEINLLCIDSFMPYEAEMYMKYRIRNLKLPNGVIFKGTAVELE